MAVVLQIEGRSIFTNKQAPEIEIKQIGVMSRYCSQAEEDGRDIHFNTTSRPLSDHPLNMSSFIRFFVRIFGIATVQSLSLMPLPRLWLII